MYVTMTATNYTVPYLIEICIFSKVFKCPSITLMAINLTITALLRAKPSFINFNRHFAFWAHFQAEIDGEF